jgi:hypothetical protein
MTVPARNSVRPYCEALSSKQAGPSVRPAATQFGPTARIWAAPPSPRRAGRTRMDHRTHRAVFPHLAASFASLCVRRAGRPRIDRRSAIFPGCSRRACRLLAARWACKAEAGRHCALDAAGPQPKQCIRCCGRPAGKYSNPSVRVHLLLRVVCRVSGSHSSNAFLKFSSVQAGQTHRPAESPARSYSTR